MRRLLREPVVQFLLVGGVLFAVHRIANPSEPEREPIVIGPERVAALEQSYRKRFGREPGHEQRERIIRDEVREEVLVREALSLGLHRTDPVVRRRLTSAMELIAETEGERAEPGDEVLQSYLDEHADELRVPARLTLHHIFFSRDGRSDPVGDARAALARAGGDAGALGDPFPKGHRFAGKTRAALAGIFGAKLARAVFELDTAEWTGPIESSYGAHLVKVSDRRAARVPELDEVRPRVLAEWRARQRADARERAIDSWRAKYRVVRPASSSP